MKSKIRPLVFACLACSGTLFAQQTFDLQGHRGARARYPENTLPAFAHAVECGCTTLELDLAVSRDSVLIVSHEPWLRPGLCIGPDGLLVGSSGSYPLFEMPASVIGTCDCGSLLDPRFPDAARQAVPKPTFDAVVQSVPDSLRFNIEIKFRPEWVDSLHPSAETFAALVRNAIVVHGLSRRVIVQSFSPEALRTLHALAPEIPTSFLLEHRTSLRLIPRELGYIPEVISPAARFVTSGFIRKARRMHMQVLPWTVNDEAEFRRLVHLGVDGIITDDPCRMVPFVPRP